MKVDKEQRRHPRLRCVGSAQLQVSVDASPCDARIMDLSIEGCLLELQKPENISEKAFVELTFSVNNLPFRVRGQIRAIRSKTVIGLQFPALSGRARRQLEDLVEELLEEQRKRRAVFGR